MKYNKETVNQIHSFMGEDITSKQEEVIDLLEYVKEEHWNRWQNLEMYKRGTYNPFDVDYNTETITKIYSVTKEKISEAHWQVLDYIEFVNAVGSIKLFQRIKWSERVRSVLEEHCEKFKIREELYEEIEGGILRKYSISPSTIFDYDDLEHRELLTQQDEELIIIREAFDILQSGVWFFYKFDEEAYKLREGKPIRNYE
mgnify:CR=1 FL=1|tara:strand:- start:343 stop:942 length:600 start_codon:yes stop_codon:yes gene_type:complete